MADNSPATDEAPEAQVTFNVKSSSDQKHTFTLPLSTTVGDLKTRLAQPEYAAVPADRQRLIYSGRILKDGDTLEQAKVKDGNTVHLVKSAASNARQNPSGAQTSPAAQVPTNIAAGTGNSPFAQLTGARHAGFHGLPDVGLFGPDGGMGPPPGVDDLANLMENPNFLQQMNEMMNNPQMLELLLDSPVVRNNPQARAMLSNPDFRRLMLSPDMLRLQLQMQRQMNGQNAAGSFAMPGETDTTAQTGRGSAAQDSNAAPDQRRSPPSLFAQNPALGGLWRNLGSGAPDPRNNPFAALFNAQVNAAMQQPQQAQGGGTNPAAPAGPNSPAPQATGQEGQNQNQPPPNPFGGLFGGGQPQQQQQQAQGAGGNASFDDAMQQVTQQMMRNPEMMRAAMQMGGAMMGGQHGAGAGAGANQGGGGGGDPAAMLSSMLGAGAGGFDPYGGFGFGSPPPPQQQQQPPADGRPPEERYASQLRQLNDMGFFDFDRNVLALNRSGGNIQGAVEFLLSS